MANSYPQTQGPPVTWWEGLGTNQQTLGPPADVDTENMLVCRIQQYTQRPNTNIGDVEGKIFNDLGNTITLVAVRCSLTDSGPWSDAIIRTTDPEYSFPTIGNPTGEAFKVPIEVPIIATGVLWIQMEISY